MGGGVREEMYSHFKARSNHTHGIANARLLVEHELPGNNVKDLAVGVDRDIAGVLHDARDILAANFARPGAQHDSSAAGHSAQMRPAHAHDRRFHLRAGGHLSLLDNLADRGGYHAEVGDGALVPALRFGLGPAEHLLESASDGPK